MRTLMLPIVAAVLTVSCLAGGAGSFKATSPDPVCWVDAERHDWGTIPPTEPVEHVFRVRNMGGAPLNIARVQTSCGCTAAVLDHQYLKPGEETRLKITFDPRGRNGQQTRTVWIHSNDPKTPQKQILIQSTIESPAPVVPIQVTPAGSSTTMGTPAVTPAPATSSTTAAAPAAPAPVVAPAPAAPATTTAPATTAPKPAATKPAPKPAGSK